MTDTHQVSISFASPSQIFYKKVIARKLWGKPMPHTFFPFYLAICVSISYLTNEYFVKSKKAPKDLKNPLVLGVPKRNSPLLALTKPSSALGSSEKAQ